MVMMVGVSTGLMTHTLISTCVVLCASLTPCCDWHSISAVGSLLFSELSANSQIVCRTSYG